MVKHPRKHASSEELALLVIEHNPQARITHQLARQIEPYLPIESFEKLAEELGEVVVEKHTLPLKMFGRHVGADHFPVESLEDLVRKLSAGVRRALALAHTPSFSIRSKVIGDLLATSLQGEPRRRTAVPVAFYAGRAPSGSARDEGGK